MQFVEELEHAGCDTTEKGKIISRYDRAAMYRCIELRAHSKSIRLHPFTFILLIIARPLRILLNIVFSAVMKHVRLLNLRT